MSSADVVNASVSCEEVNVTNYDAVVSAICATLCLFGFIYTFFGYRCFKAVMFLSGLIFGGTIVFLVCREERIFQQSLSVEVAAGIAVGIGSLCGLLTMLIKHVGLFLQGFFLGILVAFAGILALQSFYHPNTPWIPVGILFGTGVVFSVLTLKFQKQFVIISTAVFGSVLVTLCIDYFIERFLLFMYAWEALLAAPSIPVCWYTWVIISVWPALSLLGILLQWKVTSKGYDHTDVIILRGRRKQVRTHLVRSHRNEPASGGPRPTTRRSTSVVDDNGACPSDVSSHRDLTRANPAAVDGSEPQNSTASASPPSYFECVELGVGEPVREDHEVIRTDAGAYVSGRSSSSLQPETIRNPLVEQLCNGDGYSQGVSRPTTSSGRAENSPSRSPRSRQTSSPSRATSSHQPTGRAMPSPRSTLGSDRQKRHRYPKITIKHRSKGCGARRYDVSPSAVDSCPPEQGSRSSHTQLPVFDSVKTRSHRDRVAAHSQHIKDIETRRLSQLAPQQTSADTSSSTAASGGVDV